MEVHLNLEILADGVAFGQFFGIALGLILSFYFDDYRDLARKRAVGPKRDAQPFDWILRPDVIYPALLGIVFLFAVILATFRVNDLKDKVQNAEVRYAREEATLEGAYGQAGR